MEDLSTENMVKVLQNVITWSNLVKDYKAASV